MTYRSEWKPPELRSSARRCLPALAKFVLKRSDPHRKGLPGEWKYLQARVRMFVHFSWRLTFQATLPTPFAGFLRLPHHDYITEPFLFKQLRFQSHVTITG